MLRAMPAAPPPANFSMTIGAGRGAATLHVHLPSTGAEVRLAVIIVPGGSYRAGPFGWCKVAEGADIAEWFASIGVLGAVLHYRLPQGVPDRPISDALQAVATVRSRMAQRPWAVGIIGFSAGGHLAALASTLFTSSLNRPNFTMLLYPVISMAVENYTHINSRREFLGSAPSDVDVSRYSADRQVMRRTPPALLVHARDDHVVNPKSSWLYYNACATMPPCKATLVELPSGGHPFVNKPVAWRVAQRVIVAWLCAWAHHHVPRSFESVKGCGNSNDPYTVGVTAGQQPQGSAPLVVELRRIQGIAGAWQTDQRARSNLHDVLTSLKQT